LLSNAQRSVLTPNSEIAQNALSTLRILLNFNTKECSSEVSTSTWLAFWRNWVSIGRNFVEYFGSLTDVVSNDDAFQQQQNQGALTRKASTSTFGAEFFSLYFELFPPLFPRIGSKSFDSTFFAEFAEITAQGVLGPLVVTQHQTAVAHILGGSTSTALATPSFMNSFTANLVDEQGLTQTQRSVFNCLSLIAESIKTSKTNAKNLLVPFFELLLRLSQYAVRIPRPGSNTNLVEAIPMNYIIFAEKCMELATEMYKNFADSEALGIPLAAKYKCQCRSTWLLASKCFIEVITVGVPIATKQNSALLQPDSNGMSTSTANV
uniref:Mon2_C domain-containing protein n=1 Tax=Hymenolepis diminuta TaxID=6216 RepID=A0A0R3SK89_HYMDI